MTFDEGSAAALAAAKALRQEKEEEGIVNPDEAHMRAAETTRKVGRGRKSLFEGKPLPKSGVQNISWHARHCTWRVHRKFHVTGARNCYTPLDASAAEVERTRLLAVARLREVRLAHGLPAP